MILLKKGNEASAREVVVVAEDEDDMLFLHWLDYHNLVFGMWKIYDGILDQQRITDNGKWLAKSHPTARGFARINATEFIGKPKNAQTLL